TPSRGARGRAPYGHTTFTGYLGLVAKPLDKKPVVWSGPMTAPGDAFVNGHCGPGRCDDGVLDFIDVAVGPDGSVWGAFVDSVLGDELVIGHLAAR
ncbi:MAG: hypothetical protein QOG86_1703, partial [Thermoleophilaceae bacterium]|nr:hypothetical protein [Thermoleophilaceae bacterium]